MISIVNYDLHRAGQNWPGVAAFLRTFDHYHEQGSAWYIRHSGTSQQLLNQLLSLTDGNDEIDVAPIDHPQNVATTDPRLTTWLRNTTSANDAIVEALASPIFPFSFGGGLAALASGGVGSSPTAGTRGLFDELGGVLSGIEPPKQSLFAGLLDDR